MSSQNERELKPLQKTFKKKFHDSIEKALTITLEK